MFVDCIQQWASLYTEAINPVKNPIYPSPARRSILGHHLRAPNLILATTTQEIARRLSTAGYPKIDPVADHLRCFGHDLNLTVKAFL